MTPIDLTTELSREPLGLDTVAPRFSWKMTADTDRRAQRQQAYRILVAFEPEGLQEGAADVWDSGRVESTESVLVSGPERLRSRTRYYWTVRAWDETGMPGAYAEPTWFETGLLNQEEWMEDGAKWIESALGLPAGATVDTWVKHTLADIPARVAATHSQELAESRVVTDYVAKKRAQLYEQVWPASCLRRDFSADRVVSARLYICGLGFYRAYINGTPVNEQHVLAPSDSHYYANAYYQVYDVTGQLNAGRNCLAVELVNGRWRAWPGNWSEDYHDRPVLLARLELTDPAGNTRSIVTDEQWTATRHGIQKSGFWLGELFDANVHNDDWNSLQADTSGWASARAADVGNKMECLTRDPQPPERMTRYHAPVRYSKPQRGVHVYSFGKMIGGRVKLTFRGLRKGQQIIVRYSEVIYGERFSAATALGHYDNREPGQHEGMLAFKGRGSCGGGFHRDFFDVPDGVDIRNEALGGTLLYCDSFVSAGKPVEVFEPTFTYTGFRHIEILGLDKPLPPEGVQAFELHTQPEIIGKLSTDNEDLNTLLKGIQETILLNYHSQLQDNNGSERNPNALNIGLNDLNTAYWFNTYPLWSKGSRDIEALCSCVDYPVNMVAGMRDLCKRWRKHINISNSLHFGHLPRYMMAFFNDRRQAEQVLRWTLRFVRETTRDTYWNLNGGSSDHIAETALEYLEGDFIGPDGKITSDLFVKAGFVVHIAHCGIETAEALGLQDAAKEMNELLDIFEERIREQHYDEMTECWTPDHPGVQGRNTVLMYFNMRPRRDSRELCREIIDEIYAKTGGHQLTGSRLTYPLVHQLSQHGFEDEALRLLTRKEAPSLLEHIAHTGNTIRESWGTCDCFAQIEGLTEVGKWFYTDLVGILPDINHPSFAHFTLKPIIPHGVNRVDFQFASPRGKIRSHWTRNGENIQWEISVPPNSTATIHIPLGDAEAVREGETTASLARGVDFLATENDWARFRLGSGQYCFTYKLKGT